MAQVHSDIPVGLTTTESPFIEDAISHGRLYIEQPYDLYSEENHEAWRLLSDLLSPSSWCTVIAVQLVSRC